MKTLEFGSKVYRVAENWGELTPEQYVQLIMCPRLVADGSYETVDNQAAACRVWLGGTPLGMSTHVWANLVLTPWQWGQLRQQFAWLFTTTPEGKPPIGSFFCQGVNYHLPAEDFRDTSAAELVAANMAYLEFASPLAEGEAGATEKDLALCQLIATLCRPRRQDWRKFQRSAEWNGDVREPFNQARMEQHAKALLGLTLNTKLVILDYFERTNNQFLAEYGELFGGSKEPRYGDGRGWLMLLKNVAKEGHFGDFEKVCTTPANLLFATLLDDLLDQQEAEARQANLGAIQ